MAEWFSRLSMREQAILVLAVLVLSGILLHSGVIQPYQLKQVELLEERQQRQADLAWMQSAVGGLQPAGQSQSRAVLQGSLVNALDRMVRQRGLSEGLAQMSPLSNGEVRMRFRAVDFNRYLGLIAQISASGLTIKDAQVTAIDNAPGQVNSNLILARS